MTTHLAAFLITYRRPAVAAATLEAMLAQSLPPQRILVLDNGATPDLAERVRHHAGQGVSYVALEGNLGPAGAAARGLRILAESDAQWIAWGDDDDPPMTGDTFARLVEMGNAYGDEVAAVGAVGSRWDWRRGEVQRLADEELGRGPIDVDVIAGSSQLLVRANTVRQHGVPDARLFFGFEEPEYCLRLGRAGRRLLVDGELAFAYRRQAGRLALPEHRSLIPAYSPSTLWRRYYSTRNYVFAMRSTFSRPDLARREALKAVARSLGAWARGPRFGARFGYFQLRAVADGYRGRLGCTVPPSDR